MSLLAGAVHVDLQADVINFITGINKVEQSLNSVDKTSQKTGGAFEGMANIAQIAIGNVVANAFAAATSKAKEFFDSQMEGAKSFEVTRIAFDGIIGDTEKAGKIMDQVVKEAAKTPFEIPELADSAKMLAAFGVSADDVIPSIMMVGDVAAGLDVPIQDMAYLVGTIKSSGKAMTADLNQFANRGVPIWQALSKVTGKSNEELKTMASEGKITYELIEQGFKSMTSEGGAFNGMMERISGTGKGLDSTLSDTFGSIGRRIIGISDTGEVVAGGIFEKIKTGTKGMIDFLNQPSVIGFADSLGRGLSVAFGFISDLKKIEFGIYVDAFWNLYEVGRLLYTGDFRGGIFGLSEDSPIIDFLFDLREGFIALYNYTYFKLWDLKIAFMWFSIYFKYTLLPAILDFIEYGWGVLTKAFDNFTNYIVPYLINTLKWLSDTWTTVLLPGIQLFWQLLQPLIQNIIDIFNMIKPHIMPTIEFIVHYFMNYFAPLIGAAFQLVLLVIGVVIAAIIIALTALTSAIKSVVNQALIFWGYFGEGIKNIFIGITQFLTGFINVVVGIFTGNGDKVKAGFLGMFSGIGSAMTGIFQVIGGLLRKAMNDFVVGPMNKMIDAIPSEVGGVSVPKPGRIPSFRKGVENFGGGMAYVHAGEMLTNLPSGANVHTKAETQDMMGGSREVTIKFDGPFIATTESLDKLAKLIITPLKKAGI